MSDLAAWLLEQIAQREGVAHEIHQVSCDLVDGVVGHDRYDVDCDCGEPARALAECEAKRRIIAAHPRDSEGKFCYDDEGHMAGCKWAWPCPTILAVALPYADRPGYQEAAPWV